MSTSSNLSPGAVDRLHSIYRCDGPFVTVYLASGDGTPVHDHWAPLKAGLLEQGASEAAVEAVEARLGLPFPDNTAGHCVIAAADGTTVVDHAAEPPHYDFAVHDTLPYAAPLIEWDQRRLSHVVVAIDGSGADISSFGPDHRNESRTATSGDGNDGASLADQVAERVADIKAGLVVVVGEPQHRQPLVEHLATRVPVSCRVVDEEPGDVDSVAEAVVRHVSDTVARTTVAHLRDHRFLRTHADAVDGTADTLKALAGGQAERILIHDDPHDQRRIWIGAGPTELSEVESRGKVQARLVDAFIRSAVLQGVDVHIIPSTGETGPDEDTAAFTG